MPITCSFCGAGVGDLYRNMLGTITSVARSTVTFVLDDTGVTPYTIAWNDRSRIGSMNLSSGGRSNDGLFSRR